MIQDRQTWMGLLARAPAARVSTLWRDLALAPEFTWLRKPETGGVMVRGRTGGTGAAFNMGEMTVTRCALRIAENGVIGHGYIQGRDKRHAEIAALADAYLQTGAAGQIRTGLLAPLEDEERARRATRAAKAAATKVDFFTLVRGEDA